MLTPPEIEKTKKTLLLCSVFPFCWTGNFLACDLPTSMIKTKSPGKHNGSQRKTGKISQCSCMYFHAQNKTHSLHRDQRRFPILQWNRFQQQTTLFSQTLQQFLNSDHIFVQWRKNALESEMSKAWSATLECLSHFRSRTVPDRC